MSDYGVVYNQINRPKQEFIEKFKALGVATVHEAMTKDTLMDPGIRPISSGQTIAGPAVTALNSPGDNLAMHVALSLTQEGDVLVPTFLGSNSYNAIWGELATCSAVGRKLAGVIADGAVRDIAAIRKLGFPVWGRTIFPRRSTKNDVGGVNIPVVCGGILVNPGDIIIADDDGVVVVPQDEAEEILVRAQKKAEMENSLKDSLLKGSSPFELFGMKTILEQKNIKVINDIYS
jgi:4-hydroxy-4-methyl-2-oxoglutarate aldolase